MKRLPCSSALSTAQTRQFTELTGLGLPPGKTSSSAFAYADGDQDLCIGTSGKFNATALDRLLLNDGNGRFSNVHSDNFR